MNPEQIEATNNSNSSASYVSLSAPSEGLIYKLIKHGNKVSALVIWIKCLQIFILYTSGSSQDILLTGPQT